MKHGWGIAGACAVAATLLLAGCGKTENQEGSPTGTLCFDYFQRCVYPLALDTQLAVDTNNDGVFESLKRCSDSGCHDAGGSTGGGLRLTSGAATVNPTAADALGTAMHINFLSAKGRADLNNASESALLREPLFRDNHGGGRVFATDQNPAAQQILYWIQRRAPLGGDEFSPTCANLFDAGQCQALP